MKKVISILLASIMLLCMLPAVAISATDTGAVPARDTSWYNADATTFEISTAAQLLGFSDLLAGGNSFSGKTINITADIDLNSGWTVGSTDAPANAWADTTGKDFKGVINGNAHQISGIYLKAASGADASNTGIFGGRGRDNAKVQNLRIVNSYVEGGKYLGAIYGVAWVNASIDNVYCDVYVKTLAGTSNAQVCVGGLIGEAGYGSANSTNTITNCVFAGTVHATTNGTARAVGGLIGRISNCTVNMSNTAFYGTLLVQGNAIGGIIGRTEHTNSTLNAENCVVAGTITSANVQYCGSYYGQTYGVKEIKLTNCYHTKGTFAEATYFKPLPNYTDFVSPTADSTYTAIEDAALKALDAEGLSEIGLGTWEVVDGGYPVPRHVKALLSGNVLEVSPMAKDHWYTLELEDETPAVFVIDSAEDMLAFSECLEAGLDFTGKTVELSCDVDLNPEWDAFADTVSAPANVWKLTSGEKKFGGVFDGKGNTVSGIYLKSEVVASGFFGNVVNGTATVKDLSIVNSYSESKEVSHGGLFGSVSGAVNVQNVYMDIKLVNTYSTYGATKGVGVGGFVGSAGAGSSIAFTSSVFAGHIKTTKSGAEMGVTGVGGFVGFCDAAADASSTVSATDCGFFGKLECAANFASGFIGKIGNFSGHTVTVDLENVIIGGSLYSGDADWNGSFCGQVLSGEVKAENCYYIKYNNAGVLCDRAVFGAADGFETYEGCTLVSDMDIRGEDTAAWLTEKGLTAWSATNGYPLPTAVVAMVAEDDVPGLGDTPNDTVPEIDNSTDESDPSDSGENTDAADEDGTQAADTPDETTDDGKEEKGCSSSTLGGIALIVLATGATSAIIKKKKEN